MLLEGKTCLPDFFAYLGDLGALLLQLAVEASVGFGHLSQVAANAIGHRDHRGFRGSFGRGLRRKVSVGHGDEPRDVGQQFKQLGDYLWPHTFNPSLFSIGESIGLAD
jgi:hypothetical protein